MFNARNSFELVPIDHRLRQIYGEINLIISIASRSNKRFDEHK